MGEKCVLQIFPYDPSLTDYFSVTGNPCLGLGFSTGFTVISRRLCSGSLRSRWDTGRDGVPSLPPNSTPTEGAAAAVTDHVPLPVIRKLSLHAGLGQRGTVTALVAMSGGSSAKFSGKIGCLFFFPNQPSGSHRLRVSFRYQTVV